MSKDKFVNVEVVSTDLRALLFWANVGVGLSKAGSYSSIIEEVIRSYSSHMNFNLSRNTFGALRIKYKPLKPPRGARR